jgi:hypothetical protein
MFRHMRPGYPAWVATARRDGTGEHGSCSGFQRAEHSLTAKGAFDEAPFANFG